ncbi:hypothetical protein EBU71_12820, partial [bacterium]|nr:hypothetical protein [Candidatus Elulimicrobium humile]
MKLSEIHTKYDTDKGTFHSYIDKYDELFSPYQYEYIKLLEIGCLTCASTKMFNEFFPNAYIIGVDNWQQDFDHEGESFKTKGVMVEQIKKDIVDNYPRVKLITCDSTNTEQVNSIFKGKTFNIILDDGDH